MFKIGLKLIKENPKTITSEEKQIKFHENIEAGILKAIEKSNLQELPGALYLLLSKDEELKLRTAKVINKLVLSFSKEQLIKIDLLFRERTSLEWSFDWENENPNNMLSKAMSEEEQITILGLCSFHPNGYFREKAITLLGEYEDNSVIPYIIIRLNDWVNPLRILAKNALEARLIAKNAKEIINNLFLLFRLKICSRGNFEEIIEQVTNLLSSDKCHDELLQGLKSDNPKVRYYCYDIAMNSKAVDNSTLISYITKEKIPYIRLSVIRFVIKNSSVEDLKVFYKVLLKDKNHIVRAEAFYAVYKYDWISIKEDLELALLDKNGSMRETARVLLKRRCVSNFIEFYKDAINKEESLVEAIYGLGETGTSEDCRYIEKYISTESIKLLRAVMISLSKLNYEKYREFFIEKIKDERVAISIQAKKILVERIDVFDGEFICKISKETEHRHVLINTIVLLSKLPKWDSIKYILEFHGINDKEIWYLANYKLNKWQIAFNRSYNKPTARQKELIEEAINKYGEFIDEKNREFIKFCI